MSVKLSESVSELVSERLSECGASNVRSLFVVNGILRKFLGYVRKVLAAWPAFRVSQYTTVGPHVCQVMYTVRLVHQFFNRPGIGQNLLLHCVSTRPYMRSLLFMFQVEHLAACTSSLTALS